MSLPWELKMLDGFNHVAILTPDLDRLEMFYREVFEVEEVHRMDHRGLRHGLVGAGVSTGEVTDFGALLSVTFEDPDGHFCELCWMRETATLADTVDPS